MTGRRTTTAPPTPVPAGEPAPTPIEELPAAEPTPEPPEPTAPPSDPDDTLPAHLRMEVRAVVREELDNGRERWPLSVGEAIAEVTRRIDSIEKAHTTESGERYRYRGIDDVFAALHPILGDVGLVIMPGQITDHRREARLTSNSKTLNVAIVAVRYRLIGPDGTETFGEAVGEAHDSGDKATQKALSQAYKSFTLQLFSIPTEASAADEPDRLNEPGRPFTADERQRALTAWSAALAAADLNALVGVRHRAAALLDVPVEAADGELAPLSLRFDRRRAELEGAQS